MGLESGQFGHGRGGVEVVKWGGRKTQGLVLSSVVTEDPQLFGGWGKSLRSHATFSQLLFGLASTTVMAGLFPQSELDLV